MKATILGCGTSSGVPRIGNDWGACDPTEPRNARTRAAITVSTRTTTILVDTGPDMRGQLLRAGIGAVDAVIWTHEHADHVHGIDDLRQIFHLRGSPVPGFARQQTLDGLLDRFGYVFKGRHGYPSTAIGQLLPDELTIGDIRIRCVDMPHGNITSAGLLFEANGKSIGYLTDFSDFTPAMAALFEDADVWIVDALRHEPHPTHPHLAYTLDWVKRLRIGRAILTHMDHSMDYRSLIDILPAHVEPGYDGQVINL